MRTPTFLVLLPLVACRTVAEPEPVKPEEPAQVKPLPSATQKPAVDPSMVIEKPTETSTLDASTGPTKAADGGAAALTEDQQVLADMLTAAKLTGKGTLVATITTSLGVIECKLMEDKAPVTVANFIGLSNGTKEWTDLDGKKVKRPAYDGTVFHRIIKGFMIQGGDQKGNGSGEPGYTFKDEIWPGSTHDHAGQLCMANRGPNTNGAQFFITDDAAKQLDRYKSYTIFGDCNTDTVHKIASVPVSPDPRSGEPSIPDTKVAIKTVRVKRVPAN